MNDTPVNAIFENGAFRPLGALPLFVQEGDRVTLHIESPKSPTTLEQACSIYDGLSPEDIADVERIALKRDQFFSQRHAD